MTKLLCPRVAGGVQRWLCRHNVRFADSEQEARYRTTSLRDGVGRLRRSILLAIISLSAFTYFDLVYFGGAEAITLVILRDVVGVGILALGFGFTYTRWHTRYGVYVAPILVVGVGLSVWAMILVGSPPHSHAYYVGILITLVYGYVGLGSLFVPGLTGGSILCLTYTIGSIFLFDMPVYTREISNMFLHGINFIGIMGSYYIAVEKRRSFALSESLRIERDKVSEINANLELRVALRVAEAEEMSDQYRQEAAERRRAETALQVERDLLDAILDAMQDLLAVVDPKTGQLVRWNAALGHMTGYSNAVLAAMHVPQDWFPPQESSRALELMTSILPTSTRLTVMDVPIASGETLPIEFSGGLVPGADDQNLVLLIGRDVAERQRTARELASSRSRLATAMGSADLGLWELDWHSGEALFDARCQGLTGLGSGPWSRALRQILHFVHAEERRMVLDQIRHHLHREEPMQMTFRIDNGHGPRWVSVSGTVAERDADGIPTRTVGIIREATEDYALQERLREASKMEAIGRLAGGVAHDFNNLLTVINGYCEMALLDLDQDHAAREMMQIVLDEGHRAVDLTRQLLTFSRRQETVLQVLDLAMIVEEMDRLLSRLVGEDITILYDLKGSLPLIMADRTQIEQVVMNLAINARDAMKNQGGTLEIVLRPRSLPSPTRTRTGVIPEGQYVLLRVSDTGQGMSSAIMAHLFEPFYTTKEKGQGTGLGLAVVYGVVERMGGGIDVTSKVDEGTVFSIYLPTTEDAVTVPAEQQPVNQRQGHERVLLAEDEGPLRKLVARWLRDWGYEVIEASDGQEALSIAIQQRQPIDLLLTDVVMPRLTGDALAQALVSRWPTLPVVFMSGYNDRLNEASFGPNQRLLSKPLQHAQLGEALAEALGSTQRSVETDGDQPDDWRA